MKKVYLLLVLFSVSLFAQGLEGKWSGELSVGGTSLPLVFNVTLQEGKYTGAMDSPKQGAFGIPLSKVSYSQEAVMEVESIGAKYVGKLDKNVLKGSFYQAGQEFPMILTREAVKVEGEKYLPKKDKKYISEEVSFNSKNNSFKLSGTLTLPKGIKNPPLLILVSGSGPQDRNEELFGHKPFLNIADYLSNKGIAVLRYDDRGVGKSEGNFKKAVTKDFADDLEGAVKYLLTRNDINNNKIGVLGHSEGGIVANIASTHTSSLAYIIHMASPAMRGDKLLLLQQEYLLKKSGVNDSIIAKQAEINKKIYKILEVSNKEEIRKELNKIFAKETGGLASDAQKKAIESQIMEIMSPWFSYFIKYDPADDLKKIDIPVLALFGSKDLQVPAEENMEILNDIDNGNIEIKRYEGLNHLFQKANTGLPQEYGTIKETINEEVLEDIYNWIIER